MAQDNWWANDAPVGQTPPPATGGPVLGPRMKPDNPTPYQVEDQQFQRDREAQRKLEWDATHNPDGSEKPKVVTDGKPTEYQMKSNQFYGRMLTAENQYRTVPLRSRDARTGLGQAFHEFAPSLDATFNSSDRVTADNSARDWIAASLRQESGANITPAEYDNQYRIFFPMPGDTDVQRKEKELKRKQAMLGFKTSAGQLAAEAEKQYQGAFGNVMPWDMVPTPDGETPPPAGGTKPPVDSENPFTGLPGKSESGPSDPIGEDPRFSGKRYNESGQEDPQGDFNAYGQYRDFRASQSSPDGALQGSVTSFEGQPQESVDNWTNWTDSKGRTRGPDGSILSGWGGPGTGGSYEGALQQELQRQGKSDPTSAENYIMRGAQGGSFSLADELVGAMAAAKGGMQGNDPTLSYQLARDLERSRQQQNQQGQGAMGYVAEIAPSLLTGNLLGDVRGAQNAMKAGGRGGSLYGFGSGQGLEDSATRAGGGALAGAVLGGGISKFGEKVVTPGVNALTQSRLGQAVSSALRRGEGAADEALPPIDPAKLIDAGKQNKTRVMTSDAFPPTTAIGKTSRMIGENIPFAGTAGGRAAQQAERTAAVKQFAKEFEVEGGTVDGVTKNLLKTRGKQIETLTTAKNSVIDAITDPVPPMALRSTLREIDTQVANLVRTNPKKFGPVIDELQNFRSVLESGKSLRQVEVNRKLLGDLFKDANLASVKGEGQKALNAIYAPLRDDMGNFIRSQAGAGSYNKWATANKKLSDMMGDLKSSKFKSTLNNGATTPEEAGKLLFSQTPSDVARLVKELSPVGQAKARSAVVAEALRRSSDDATGMVSPDKFLTAIGALKPSTGVLFKGVEGERLDGLKLLLAGTRRAASSNAEISTGLQGARLSVAGLSATNPWVGVPAGLLARVYESPAVRNLLVKLSKAEAGSPAQEATRNRLTDILARMAAQRGPEAANDTFGSVLGQSPGRAAAQDEPN